MVLGGEEKRYYDLGEMEFYSPEWGFRRVRYELPEPLCIRFDRKLAV